MSDLIWFVLIPLLFLHGPSGREIEVNAYDIASIAEPRDTHFGAGTKCVITLSNSKFVAVREPCSEIVRMVVELGKKRKGEK